MRAMSVIRNWFVAVTVCAALLWMGAGAALSAPPARASAAARSRGSATTSAPDRQVQMTAPDGGASDRIEEVHFRDVELAAALRMLTMQTKDNVVMSSRVDGSQRVEANLYDVTFTQVLDSILTPLGLGYRRDGNFIYIYTAKELEQMAKEQRATRSAIFKLHYVTAADAAVLIKPLLSQVGQVAVTPPAARGIDSGAGGSGGNSLASQDVLVVTDTPDKLAEVEKAVKELDVRPRQVLIEATILKTTLDDENHLGIDFNTLGGIDFRGLEVGETSSTAYPGHAQGVDGGLPRANMDRATFNLKTDFNDPALFPKGGFSFGIVTNNVAAFIRALESVADTVIVANPKVLALNKQRGEVIVGRRDGYLTTVMTETETTQKVEFLETGFQLVFRPYIGDDGYVRMEVHPKDSSGGVTGGLPREETTEVTTNVLVKDGHTIVIGGLFREESSAEKAQVPFLGNIPYAGALFRRKADTAYREEVIVLLTVHIVESNQAYAQRGEKVLEDVERIRVGVRGNLACYGREQLSHAHFRWALEHLRQGDRDRAMWDLNMALHLSPQFIDAIRKREELLGLRAWESNGSILRNFIYNRLLGAEDRWIDSMGAPVSELGPPCDVDSPEWGRPTRSMCGPTTQPDGPKDFVIITPGGDESGRDGPPPPPAPEAGPTRTAPPGPGR